MNVIGNRLSSLNRKTKLAIIVSSDVIMALTAWIIFGPPLINAVGTNFSITILDTVLNQFFQFFFPVVLAVLFMNFFGFYRSIIRFFDSVDSIVVSIFGSMIFGFGWSLIYLSQTAQATSTIFFVAILQGFVLSVMFYALLNTSRDIAKLILYPYTIEDTANPVVIYGAGAAGKELMQTILLDRTKNLVAFFDDSRDLKNRLINNIPIYGSIEKLKSLRDNNNDLEVLLAIPSLESEKRRDVIAKLEKLKISVRTVPAFHELIFDSKKMSDIQNLSLDDLLPPREIDNLIVNNSESREFLVTGAGGSIGSEIVRQLINYNPKKIILFEISEFNLFKIFEETKALKKEKDLVTEIYPILGDIKDRNHLRRLFNSHDIDTIYHAAAYKHVPLVEDVNNISKSIENNLLGTFNLAEESISAKVKSFVLISTDKAVRPTNIMGATKRLAEIAIQVLNHKKLSTKLCMVRFGNVINSSGSVIPLFLDQIANGGPVTITHKDVERYFMTIPEASNLVLQAGEMSKGGEVFILDMGEQMKVIDIAKKLIHLSGRSVAETSNKEGIEIIEVGLRDGEKMFEELLISGNEEKTSNSRIFKSNESFVTHEELNEIIKDMSDAIIKNDTNKITEIMTKYVDGFKYE